MIQNLIFEILVWKYYFGHKMFLYSSTHSSGHHLKLFLIFRFSSRKSQSLTKVSEKITHFTTRFRSKNLAHFKTSTQLTLKKICCGNTDKNLYDFTNFPANMFLFGIRKNIGTAPFLDAQELHAWSTLKANVCIFLYISVWKFLFRRRCKIYLMGSGLGGSGIIFLRWLAVWTS